MVTCKKVLTICVWMVGEGKWRIPQCQGKLPQPSGSRRNTKVHYAFFHSHTTPPHDALQLSMYQVPLKDNPHSCFFVFPTKNITDNYNKSTLSTLLIYENPRVDHQLLSILRVFFFLSKQLPFTCLGREL